MQFDLGESLKNRPQDLRVLKSLELVDEQELFNEDVAHVCGELGHILYQATVELPWVLVLQRFQVKQGKTIDLDGLPHRATQHQILGGVFYTRP